MSHVFLVAAEDSGDAVGADVIDALRAKGIAVGYVQFKDEGHGFTRKPNNDARREAETVFLQGLFGK